MNIEARNKLTKARANLILDYPFFGSLSLRLKLIEDITCPTAWTNGISMGYNPDFILALSLDEIKAVIAHEVMHLATCQHTRRGNRHPLTWNIAGDLAINPILEKSGFTLPQGALLYQDYYNMAAEAIYNKLPQPPKKNQGKAGQQGQGKGQGQGQPGQQGQGKGQGQGQLGQQQGSQGQSTDPGGIGEIRDTPGQGQGQQPTASEIAQAEESWKIAVNQAAQQAKAQGNLPGHLDRLINEIVNPKLPWQDILRRFIDNVTKTDYSWTVPNRRFIGKGLYLPSVRDEDIGDIIVAVDTSGSISQKTLNQFAAELTAILDYMNPTITVIYADTRVQSTEIFTKQDLPLKLHPKGGGGTDFRPAFKYVESQGLNPRLFLYLTDLECNRYPEAPLYPVLWIVYGRGGYFSEPPFGDKLNIEE